MDIGKQIRDARKAKGLTLETLANQVDTDTGNLSRLERGLQGASHDLLKRIMSVLDLKLVNSVYDPSMGSGGLLASALEHLITNVELSDQPSLTLKLYPLVEWDKAESWAESPDKLTSGDNKMFLASLENAGENGFWMEVRGDVMTCNGNPSFPEGSRILVQPGAEVISGKYYVVITEGGEQTFRQYIEDAGSKYLRPLNPSYRTVEIFGNCRFIGRVIDTKMTGL
ncbi:S24 family peptidase [Pseudomonas sp. 681]|uniref:S24 family peptidase n=1 Tax=Pseudomonas fungipugnans TaxID=3024217 RepID=A0ABT6QVS9_9PSED|nr:S24 family peptidase [Pseudomonas sp. 681]MDI2594999.1 S24 family peptidase [Pseudomonas sp. 681]